MEFCDTHICILEWGQLPTWLLHSKIHTIVGGGGGEIHPWTFTQLNVSLWQEVKEHLVENPWLAADSHLHNSPQGSWVAS